MRWMFSVCKGAVLILCLVSRCDATVVQSFFSKIGLFSDTVDIDITNDAFGHVYSSLGCASLCSEHGNCSSYFFNMQDAYCQLNRESIAQGNLQPYHGTVYYEKIVDVNTTAVKVIMDKLSFSEAFARCESLGSRLVVAETWEKLEQIIDQVVASGLKGDFYVGCKKDIDGSFRWLNGVELNNTMWRTYEPSAQPGEDCVTFYPGYFYSLLNDDSCLKKFGFICENL